MILALHIVIGILLGVLIIRYFLDYSDLKREKDLNTNLLLNLYAYKMFNGDLDSLMLQKARSALQDLVTKEVKENGK